MDGELAQGRIWHGAEAVENGLVDELGGLEDAIRCAAEMASLPADGYRRQLVRVGKPSIAEQIGDRVGAGAAMPFLAALEGGGMAGSPLSMVAREVGVAAGGGVGSAALAAAVDDLEALAAHTTHGTGRPLAILPSAIGL